MRSLANKMDELQTLIGTQPEYRESSLCQAPRADRDLKRSRKRKGAGLAVLVNNRWCHPGHVTVKCRLCSTDMETWQQVSIHIIYQCYFGNWLRSTFSRHFCQLLNQRKQDTGFVLGNCQGFIYLQIKTSYGSLVFLCSEYKPLVQRQPVTRRSVRKWSQEAEGTLQGCFETTNWSLAGTWRGHQCHGRVCD